MNRLIIAWAAVLGGTAVLFGALGAHALRELIDEDSLQVFKTGIRYQAWHALAVLVIGFSEKNFRFKKATFRFWLFGTILFSFSLYLLATSGLTGLPPGFIGPITPIGGLLMIIGWGLLFVGVLKSGNIENQSIN